MPVPKADESWEVGQAIDTPTSNDFRASPYEEDEVNKADAASDMNMGARSLEATAATLKAIPMFMTTVQLFGVSATVGIDNGNIADGLSCLMDIIKMRADKLYVQSSFSSVSFQRAEHLNRTLKLSCKCYRGQL